MIINPNAKSNPNFKAFFRFQDPEFFIVNLFDGRNTLPEIQRLFESKYRPQTLSMPDLRRFLGQLEERGLIGQGDPPKSYKVPPLGNKIIEDDGLNDIFARYGSTPSIAPDQVSEESPTSPTAAYDQLTKDLAAMNHAMRVEIASRLQTALNVHIRAMPHDDLDGKKRVAEFVNGELERFGLAVQCPNTERPAKLKGTTGSWVGVGRFCFETYHNGKREKSAYSDTLPELKLIDATPPKEPEVNWQQSVGPKESRSGRRRQ